MAADAETNLATPSAPPARRPAPPRYPPPQLRLHDRQVYVGFGPTPLAEGLSIADLALTVPDVSFPFDIAGGAATRYQRKKCRFGYLDLEIDHSLFARAVAKVLKSSAEHVAALRLHLGARSFEGEGSLHAPDGPAPFTFRVGFAPEGSGVIACVYDVRLYGPTPLPAPFAAAVLARAALRAAALPDATAFGAVGLAFDPVAGLVRRAVPLRGFRVPDCSEARLERVEPGPRAFHLHFAQGGRSEVPLESELLTCVEGTRAFEEGEALLAQGDLSAAEAFFLKSGEAPDAHPFARERLLGLLCAREDAHDLALDVAQSLRQSRPGAAAGFWAEACIRLDRGEKKAAGELFLKLGALARSRGEEASAFQAFCAAGRALFAPAPGLASRALQEALALRPDDLEALQALAVAADRAADPEGALRAYRRIAALAKDPAQAARSHVRMGELLEKLTRDHAGARLHFDAALKRVPGDPDALIGMARLCRADGEHLRALKLLDELRVEAARRGDAVLEALACLEAGAAWDEGLSHPANALLRYQEAERLAPKGYEASLKLGALLTRLSRPAEAAEAWQRGAVHAEAQIGRVARSEEARLAAHRAHHALASLAAERLGDPVSARRHLEAAARLDPDDPVALRALLPAWREEKRHADVARACERCAAVAADAQERAGLLSEAGELLAGPLSDPTRAAAVLEQALLVDPGCERALEATARLAEEKGDGARLCRALLKLAEAATLPRARAVLLRRLARAARDVASDLDLAADALARALALEPDTLPDLGELCALHRRRDDVAQLEVALAAWARALERDGQFTAAAEALRERGRLLDGKLGRGAEALSLLEKAAALAPESRPVLQDLAELSLRGARPLAAREAYRALLSSLPKDARADQVALLQAGLGRACQALGEREAALEALAAAFAALPLDDDLAARLDALLADAGREADRAVALLTRGRAKKDASLPGAAAVDLLAAARIFEKLGDANGARSAFEATLAADPDGPTAAPALDALAEDALLSKDSVRASDLFSRRAVFEKDGRAAARRLYRAAVLVKEAAPARFRALLGQAVERDGDYPPARATLAWLRLNEKDAAQALAHARIALADRADPDALDAVDGARLQKLAARAATELSDWGAARFFLAGYIEVEPDDVEALSQLVDLYRRSGDRAELVPALQRLAGRLEGTEAAAALKELAPLLFETPGRRAEALDAWRRALQLEPDDRTCLDRLAAALDQPGEAEERLQLLRLLVERAGSDADRERLFLASGEILFARERYEEAAQAYQAAVAAASRKAVPLERLAQAAERAGDAGTAVQALSQRAFLAAETHEKGAIERLLVAGSGLVALRRIPEARRAYELAAELASEDSSLGLDALDALVGIAENSGERAAAAEVLRRLAGRQVGSERCNTLLRRCAHLQALGDHEEAFAALEEALAASPGDRRALLALRETSRVAHDDRGLVQALVALLGLPLPDRKEAAAQASELADAHLRLGEKARAEAALRQALSYDRAFPLAEERLLSLLLVRGELTEALPMGEKLACALPDAEAAARLVELSRLADEKGHDPALALRLARLANERAPLDRTIRLQLFDLLYREGAVAEALPLAGALAREADFDADLEGARLLHLRLAELCLESRQRDLAVEVLRGLLERAPEDAAAADQLYEALVPTDPAAAVTALARHARALTPGSRSRALFLKLAEDARKRLASPRAAAEFLELAGAIGGEGLDLELARVEALREANDPPALAKALRALAEKALLGSEPDRALAALDEAASLSGTSDPRGAAVALGKAAELCGTGRPREAALRWAAQARLLRDSLKDAEGAERALRRAFQLDPQDFAPAREAAELCRLRGDASGEAELLEAIVPRLDPEARAQTLVRLSQLRVDLGDSAVAAAHLEEALRLDPRLDAARDLYEQILGLEGRVAELAHSTEARAQVTFDPTRRAALLQTAAQLYLERVGDRESAARALKAACETRPDDLGLAESCAEALCAIGRSEEARPMDAAIVAADPLRQKPFERQLAHLKDVGDLGGRAMLLEARAAKEPAVAAAAHLVEAASLRDGLGHRDGAARNERQAFALDPANERAFAATMARAGADVDEVSGLLSRRAQAVPGEAAALHRTRAQLLSGASRAEPAAHALDEALAIDPHDAEALALRGDVAETLGGDAAAEPFDQRLLDCLNRGAAVPPMPQARAHYRLGFAALARDEAASAAEHLGAGYALDPLHPRAGRALEMLAGSYSQAGDKAMLFRVRMAQASRAGDPETRAASYFAAAEAAPDPTSEVAALSPLVETGRPEAALLERLAMALTRLGKDDAAAVEYERAAVAARDGVQRARMLLAAAQCAAKAGDAARARALRQDARKSDPSGAGAARAILPDLREAGERGPLIEALTVLAETGEHAEAQAARFERAQLLEQGGEKTEAAEAFLGLVRGSPDAESFAQAAERAHALLCELRRFPEAAEALAAGARRVVAGPRRAAQLVEAARLLEEEAGDERGAEKLLVEAAQSAKDAPEPHAALARLCERRGDAAGQARALEEEAARLTDLVARTGRLVQAGRLYASAKEPERAIAVLQAAVDLAPQSAEPRFALADVCEAQGSAPRALSEMLRLAGDAPEAVKRTLLKRAAKLAAASDHGPEAQRIQRVLFELDPADDESWQALKGSAALSDPTACVEALLRREKALAARGAGANALRVALVCERANVHAGALAQPDEAERAWRSALSIDPSCRAALAGLRELAISRGDAPALLEALEAEADAAEGAEERFQLRVKLGDAARKVDPARAAATYEIAIAEAQEAGLPAAAAERSLAELLQVTQPGQAAAMWEALAQKEPADVELRAHASQARLAAGDRVEARDHLRKALELAPEREDLLELFEVLCDDAPREQAFAFELRARRATTDEARVQNLLRAADALEEAGDPQAQKELLLKALDAHAGNRQVFDHIALLLKDQPGELVQMLQNRAESVPEERAALLARVGELRLKSADLEGAAQAFEESLSVDPRAQDAIEGLAEARVRGGRLDPAELEARLAKACEPVALAVARLCEGQERYSEAMAHFALAARRGVHPEEALAGMERVGEASGASAEALEEAEKLLRARPQSGPEMSSLHLKASEWASALDRPDDALKHLEVAVVQGAGGPDALRRLAEQYLSQGTWAEAAATLTWFAEQTDDLAARAAAWRKAVEVYAEKSNDPAQAAAVAERALVDEPDARDLMERIAELEIRRGEPERIVRALERVGQKCGADSLARFKLPYSRALWATGKGGEALTLLKDSLTGTFDEETATQVRDLAQAEGQRETAIDAELALIGQLSPDRASEAAQRLRALAERLGEPEPARAAELLVRASSLAPDDSDPEREAALRERAGDLGAAAKPLLLLARRDPLDALVLGRLAGALGARGDEARAGLLSSMQAFLDPARRFPAAALASARVTDGMRARVCEPVALGPIARLLRALAPALGSAFAGDLSRYEVGETDRVGPLHAPALAARIREAREAVGLSALDAFLAPAVGAQVALEPGAPDRLIVGLPALTDIEPGALSFLLVRACELSLAGFALAGQAGADGLLGLVRCALAASGAQVSVPDPFDAMVEPLTEAVHTYAPPDLASLVALAEQGLEGLDAAALLSGMERSAARVALVACGDPGAALRALAQTAASGEPVRDLADLGGRDPAAADLVLTGLRDDWADLRRACSKGSNA